MTIERIQSATLGWAPGGVGRFTAPARSEAVQGVDSAPQDRVVVSDQAQRLANGEPGTGLQLDFKKLRELAFRSKAPGEAPTDPAA
jgi:hypothetical protein